MDRGQAHRVARAVTVVAVVGVAVAGFLPWLRSGQVVRDSFQVVRVADELDLTDSIGQQVAVVLWYLLPALCALVLLAVVLRRPALLLGLGAACGSLAVAAAGLALVSPLPSETGPWVALVAGAATAAASLVAWWTRPRRGTRADAPAQ